MTQQQAHEFNIDAAQRELDGRNAQGEDVSHLRVCEITAQIVPTGAPAITAEQLRAQLDALGA